MLYIKINNTNDFSNFLGKSLVNRVGQQLHKAFTEKGIAFLVNHGIAEDKVSCCIHDAIFSNIC